MNKRGQLGMDIGKGFILGLLILIIISFIGIIIFGNLTDVGTTSVPQFQTLVNGTIVNESFTLSNIGNASTVASPRTNFTSLALRNIVVINSTSASDPSLTTGNFTQNLGNFTATTTSEFQNRTVNVSFDYSYNLDSVAKIAQNDILSNSTSGLATFWSNAGTWFSLLSIVILILIVAVVLVVVTRFSGGRSEI